MFASRKWLNGIADDETEKMLLEWLCLRLYDQSGNGVVNDSAGRSLGINRAQGFV